MNGRAKTGEWSQRPNALNIPNPGEKGRKKNIRAMIGVVLKGGSSRWEGGVVSAWGGVGRVGRLRVFQGGTGIFTSWNRNYPARRGWGF